MSSQGTPITVRQLSLGLEPEAGACVPLSPTAPRSARRAASEVREITPEDLAGLTANELRLLKYAAIGLSDKQIAGTVKRSYRTVQTQMRLLRHKLHMSTRFQLGFYASQVLGKDIAHG